MLRRWRDTTSSTALYRDLYRALCHNRVGLDNVAKEFCGKEKPKMHFLGGLLTIRAGTNFEADQKMKKKMAEYKLWFSPVRDAEHYFLTATGSCLYTMLWIYLEGIVPLTFRAPS